MRLLDALYGMHQLYKPTLHPAFCGLCPAVTAVHILSRKSFALIVCSLFLNFISLCLAQPSIPAH